MSSPFGNPVITVTPIISYNGTDISATIGPNLSSLKFVDSISYKSDSVELNIEDADGRFRKVFTFKGAVPLTLAIQVSSNGKTLQGDYGSFEIHKVKIKRNRSGGTTALIRGNSCPVSGSARLQGKSRAWASTTLKTMAGQIATQNQMTLKYLAPKDYPVARSDQANESDLVILARNCEANGLCLKIRQGFLTIFDRIEYEAKPAVATISEPTGLNGTGGIIDWDFDYSLEDIYAASQLTHFDPNSGRLIKGNFTDPNKPPTGANYQETGRPYIPLIGE